MERYFSLEKCIKSLGYSPEWAEGLDGMPIEGLCIGSTPYEYEDEWTEELKKTDAKKLIKEFIKMSREEDNDFAEDKCFCCALLDVNKGIGNTPCKFAPICGKTEREMLLIMIS